MKVVERVVGNPRMGMASKTRKIVFFRYHNHTIGLAYSGSDRFFVKGSECTQIDHLDSTAVAIDAIGGSRTRLQYHRAPANDSDAGRPIPDANTTGLAYWQRVVAFGDTPIFSPCPNNVALPILRWLRTIEASPLQESYG